MIDGVGTVDLFKSVDGSDPPGCVPTMADLRLPRDCRALDGSTLSAVGSVTAGSTASDPPNGPSNEGALPANAMGR